MPDAPPSLDPAHWESVLDEVEGAFTIAMPRGWRNRAWLRRNGVALQELATSTSPDGATALFLGDPTLPTFVMPGGLPSPGAVVRPYTSVEHFLPAYVQHRFGGAPGFRVVGMAPCPELFRQETETAHRNGVQAWVTAGKLRFSTVEGGRETHVVILACCTALPPVWWVNVAGVSSTEDPEPFVAPLLAMRATRAATPETQRSLLAERARNAAAHDAAMRQLDANAALLRAGHERNMATLRGMAAGHAAHMAALHAAHDAQVAGWREQQAGADAAHAAHLRRDAADDERHRVVLNGIREERTVEDAEGNTWQVADGYDRYFRRRTDGAVVGTASHRDLSGLPGIDPAAFEELRIRR